MKKIISILAVLAIVCLAGSSCNSDVKYKNGEAAPVEGLLTPATDYFLELRSGSGSYQNFAWSPSTVSDGYKPMYEVVFYDAPGGKELARLDAGVKTSLSASHKDINRIAGLANIEPGTNGSLYWSVVASRGISQAVAVDQPHKLNVKRLLGFNFIPEKLYITGDASEGGADLANAVQFRTLAEGEYEIFTQLTSGNFMLVDATSGTPRSYTPDGSALLEGGTGAASPGAGIYQIVADFNVRAITIKKITKVDHWFCPTSTATEMIYAGKGCWTLNYTVALKEESWGKDERYSFRAYIAGNAWPFELWGSTKIDNSRPASLTGDYFKIKSYPSTSVPNTGYDYSYKYQLELDAVKIKLTLDMSANGEYYHHTIEK